MNDFRDYEDYIQHYGVKGMHWGIRRYQPYPDGHEGGKEIGEASKSSGKGPTIGHMKRSIRNSQRLLNEHRFNETKRKNRNDFELGKIDRDEYKARKKEAKKEFVAERSRKYEFKDDHELAKKYRELKAKTISEVPHENLKRGVHIANKILTGGMGAYAGLSGVGITALGVATGQLPIAAYGAGMMVGAPIGTAAGYAVRNLIRRQFT